MMWVAQGLQWCMSGMREVEVVLASQVCCHVPTGSGNTPPGSTELPVLFFSMTEASLDCYGAVLLHLAPYF